MKERLIQMDELPAWMLADPTEALAREKDEVNYGK